MSAISNGIEMIDAITAAGRGGLPLARIVEATGVPKSSAHRLLREMVALGILRLDSDTAHYRGGLRLARLGAAVMANYDLRTMARPALEGLQRATGQVATLGIRDGDVGIYVDKIEPADTKIRLHSEVGKQFPLHCTGLGKVLLAYADGKTRQRVLKRKLQPHTPNTITDAAALRKELDRVREQGYAIDDEEITRGLICVAAPVLDAAGDVGGAISATMPVHLAEEKGLATVLSAVVHYAGEVSA